MIVHECKQGSPEWHQLRLGRPTASVFSQIVTPINGDLSKSSIKLAHKLLAERFLGYPLDSFTSAAMEAGREGEPKARAWYEFRHDCEVREVGICFTDDGRIGASPDGIVGPGLIEIKCPNPDTHIGYMLNEAGIGAEYRTQIQGQLWICEAEWLDSLSYCPPFPPRLKRIERDEEFITSMSSAVRQFADQLDELEAKLRGLGCLQMVQEMEHETMHERDETLGMTDAEAQEFLHDLMEQSNA
jgi:hypothetical protein